MSAICHLCDDVINKIAYTTDAAAVPKSWRQRLLIHMLVRGTGTPEIAVIEAIKSHLT